MGSYTRANSPDRGIQRLLPEAGIGYEWLPELGNPERDDPDMVRFKTEILPDLAARTERLLGLATASRVCLMCCCKQAPTCHRALITAWLKS